MSKTRAAIRLQASTHHPRPSTSGLADQVSFFGTMKIPKSLDVQRTYTLTIIRLKQLSNNSSLKTSKERLRYAPVHAPYIDRYTTSTFPHSVSSHSQSLQGSTLKFNLIPIAASSTSRYLSTPGTATCVTSSPPAHFCPDLSSQQSFFGSSPLIL